MTAGRDPHRAAIAGHRIRSGLRRAEQAAKLAGCEPVIGIEEQQPLPACGHDPGVTRTRDTNACGRSDAETRVAGGVTVRNLQRGVGRSIVDDDRFPILETLFGHAIQRGRQRIRRVARGNDDGDSVHPRPERAWRR